MKKQNHFIVLLLIIFGFSSSCTKDKAQFNQPTPIPTPNPIPPPPIPIARNIINVKLLQIGNLAEQRSNVAIASAGNKILFAGGTLFLSSLYSSRVDIFDITTNSWTTAELSQARTGIATAVLGKKIFFAGGETGSYKYTGRVDIYDTETNRWTKADLDKIEAKMTGASAGDKVVFASGETAHIYDALANAWSTAPLSDRIGSWGPSVYGIAATAIDKTIYFAGGIDDFEIHKAIDIYNTETETWSKSSLNGYKGGVAGIASGNTIFWAGGQTWNGREMLLLNQVEIRDMNSGTVTMGSLFQGNAFFSAIQKKENLIFFTGLGLEKNKLDIYDLNTKTWSIGLMPKSFENAAIISVNDIIYVAGGTVDGSLSSQVWKLEF